MWNTLYCNSQTCRMRIVASFRYRDSPGVPVPDSSSLTSSGEMNPDSSLLGRLASKFESTTTKGTVPPHRWRKMPYRLFRQFWFNYWSKNWSQKKNAKEMWNIEFSKYNRLANFTFTNLLPVPKTQRRQVFFSKLIGWILKIRYFTFPLHFSFGISFWINYWTKIVEIINIASRDDCSA